ncbi:MAG: recombination regulator RecX [Clostridiales bacterium]|nr:recombination regulator RecX [Clostridiales bacterium]
MRKDKGAREQALSLLERADRTEQELVRKLQDRGCESGEIEEALAFLRSYHYVDDANYACRYVRTHAADKSRRRIREELTAKGVAREWIDAALEENEVDEESQVRALLRRYGWRSDEKQDPTSYRRLTATLARRGFSFDVIRRAMGDMEEQSVD